MALETVRFTLNQFQQRPLPLPRLTFVANEEDAVEHTGRLLGLNKRDPHDPEDDDEEDDDGEPKKKPANYSAGGVANHQQRPLPLPSTA